MHTGALSGRRNLSFSNACPFALSPIMTFVLSLANLIKLSTGVPCLSKKFTWVVYIPRAVHSSTFIKHKKLSSVLSIAKSRKQDALLLTIRSTRL